MGSSKWYKENGAPGAEYKVTGQTANGIKIVKAVDDNSQKTPLFSNTPYTMYASLKGDTGKVKQITAYGKGKDGRAKLKDIDIGHKHTNKSNGLRFRETDIHVHGYDENGVRSNEARRPSKKEKRLIMQALHGRE